MWAHLALLWLRLDLRPDPVRVGSGIEEAKLWHLSDNRKLSAHGVRVVLSLLLGNMV